MRCLLLSDIARSQCYGKVSAINEVPYGGADRYIPQDENRLHGRRVSKYLLVKVVDILGLEQPPLSFVYSIFQLITRSTCAEVVLVAFDMIPKPLQRVATIVRGGFCCDSQRDQIWAWLVLLAKSINMFKKLLQHVKLLDQLLEIPRSTATIFESCDDILDEQTDGDDI